MGLGESNFLDDSDGGGKAASSLVSCSICFDVVMEVGGRSWAKLQCGHQFHLDCIGSAFNAKGAMQCPNCRNTEKGHWLYSNGSRRVSDFNLEDLSHDDDLYDFNYAEMSFGVHWCPFSGLTNLPSSLDEGEFSSNASHPCPYIAYLGPIHPPPVSNGSSSDSSSFNTHWSGPSEAPSSYAFHSMDPHYSPWDQSSPFPTNTRVTGPDPSSLPPLNQRTSRNNSDIPRPGVHPFVMSHSSSIRGPTPVHPHFSGNISRPRDRVLLQAHLNNTAPARSIPVIQSGRRSMAQATPQSSTDQGGGFYFMTSSSSGENHNRTRFHGWGREYQHHSFPLNLVDGDSIWAPFQPPRTGTGRMRHGSEMMPPSSQYHHPS